MIRDNRHVIVCLCLALAILVVYQDILDHHFVDLDDYEYVVENQPVRSGLSARGVVWAFTTMHTGNWHPLTWLSHMFDCQLYGLSPGLHHLSNLMLHMANSILLFFAFKKMTGGLWRSAGVAALFALHPLHVESVAWVAERKDLLCAFFWMSALWFYAAYAQAPGIMRYMAVFLSFMLGLLAKPMIVTLPFVLLLLDYWPLERYKKINGQANPVIRRFILEKIPLLILSALSSIVTFIAQSKGGAVGSLDVLPFSVRVSNAAVSYISYIEKMFWPSGLAVLYPHPGVLPVWQSAGAFLLLGVLTVLFLKSAGTRPYLCIGWLWYLGTLVPVIGLVQVGLQAMADRYTYIPLIGLFISIAWGVADCFKHRRYTHKMIALIAGMVFVVLVITAGRQVSYWENSESLFEHTLAVTEKNYLAHNNLGVALAHKGRTREAVHHYIETLRINPNFADAHNNIGVVMADAGKTDEAFRYFQNALRIRPEFAEAHNNLGIAFFRKGDIPMAIKHFRTALQIRPDYGHARHNLRQVLLEQSKK